MQLTGPKAINVGGAIRGAASIFKSGFGVPMLPAYKRSIRILERKRRELSAELANYDCIQASRTGDGADDSRLALDREIATAYLEHRSNLIRQIADALIRIDHDEYGVCVRCGEEIPVARLHAIPWTPHCIQCQEIADREHYPSKSNGTRQQSVTVILGDDSKMIRVTKSEKARRRLTELLVDTNGPVPAR